MLGAELFWKVEIYICYLQRKLPTINNLLTRTKFEKLLAIQMGYRIEEHMKNYPC